MSAASIRNVPAEKLLNTDDINSIVSIEMANTDDWMRLPDFFAQRNHGERSIGHLRKFISPHAIVACVRVGGQAFKLDGHTRARVWSEGLSDRVPTHVHVTTHRVGSMEEAKLIYDAYDNKRAAKTGSDHLYGGMRQFGIKLNTPWLAAGRFVQAMNVATDKVAPPRTKLLKTPEQKVEFYREELLAIDAMTPPRHRLISPFLAGALMSFKIRPEATTAFLKEFFEAQAPVDPSPNIMSLPVAIVAFLRDSNQPVWGSAAVAPLFARAFAAAIAQYEANPDFKATEFSQFFNSVTFRMDDLRAELSACLIA